MSCGSTQLAPMDYLADTQEQGAIMLDSREGPVWMDDERDQVVVGLDPGEMSLPEAAVRVKVEAEARIKGNIFREATPTKIGQTHQTPGDIRSRWEGGHSQ